MSDISRTEQSDVWHVQISNGEVREGTLEDLDAAFESGAISVDTLVLGPGQTAWARLGEVAGLDEPGDAAGQSNQAAPSAPPSPAPFAASIAPPSLSGSGLNSVRPVVTERLDLDFDPPKFQRSKGRGIVYAIMALVVVGGGIAAFTSTNSTAAPTAAAAAAGVEGTSAPAAPSPPPVLAPPPPPAPPAPPAPAVRLTPAQLKALADADKGRDAKRKSKVAAPSSGKRSSRKAEPSPFHNGGNPHDPSTALLSLFRSASSRPEADRRLGARSRLFNKLLVFQLPFASRRADLTTRSRGTRCAEIGPTVGA